MKEIRIDRVKLLHLMQPEGYNPLAHRAMVALEATLDMIETNGFPLLSLSS